MIRILAALAGLVFAGVALLSFGFGAYAFFTEEPLHSAEHEFHLEAHGPESGFSFDGIFFEVLLKVDRGERNL